MVYDFAIKRALLLATTQVTNVLLVTWMVANPVLNKLSQLFLQS